MRNLWNSFFNVFYRHTYALIAVVLLLLSTSIRAQTPKGNPQTLKEMEEAIFKLDLSWNLGGGTDIPSNALKEAARSNVGKTTISKSWCLYSFRNNELETIKQATIDADIKQFSSLLKQAFDEYSRSGKNQKLNKLGKWIGFMQFRVSDLPLKAGMLDLSRSKGEELQEVERSYTQALLEMTDKIATSTLKANEKLLAFRYLASRAISIPWIWNYLDPAFMRLSKKGGATTEMLTFNRLGLGRVPNMKSDSKIWRKAPRFYPEDMTIVDRTSQAAKTGMSIEFNKKETRVTYRMPVALKESWMYFDKTSMLVDCETKEQYRVKRMEGGYPLGKTFVVVGCDTKIIELTLIYPPVKKSMKYFTMENKTVFPVDKTKRIRYMQKHNMMSDGGWSSSKTTYKVADFVK